MSCLYVSLVDLGPLLRGPLLNHVVGDCGHRSVGIAVEVHQTVRGSGRGSWDLALLKVLWE